MTSILLYFSTFILGLIIGSFLNCVIYRLEKEESLWGRSYCPNCKHNLAWYDLVPIFSFIFLGGKCRYCKFKISFNYPLIELITAIVFLLISMFYLIQPVLSLHYLASVIFYFYIASTLIVIFAFDLKHYIIPDKVLFPAILLTIIYQLAVNYQFLIFNLLLSAIGASLFFFIIFLISGGRWIGFGDVKFAIFLGLILGFPNILVGLFLAFFFGAIIGSILMLFKFKGLKSELPFAPFLICGTFLAMFFGENLIEWYLKFLI